ncbi:GSCFA domain-containing protein [Microvirga sp. BT689]|uniref:GSCFA domain-containing protein n=1 Tax=Microvirga arvi TaxID=2778731 RepID=UPI001951FF55|nr:GSCFA domain-containing protein [Microvirga arvi]MBM6582741.1 GSCFA domain-containing protein [Microvirga arvi]
MNPYQSLPPRAFWKTAVAHGDIDQISGLGQPTKKLERSAAVSTAGSCFAQHISRQLRANGFNFIDAEPAPEWLIRERRAQFGYGIFSARFGNIYSSAQLKQLIQRASGSFTPTEAVWRTGERFFDPFRPSIEPNGFESAAEVQRSQETHLRSVASMFKRTDVFIFTLGLTEIWRSKEDGAVYPSCPGVQAGSFDAGKYEFVNLTFEQVISDMRYVIDKLLKIRPHMRFIFTVSPVPLTATASSSHVLTATTYSKSVLRAVAGQLAEQYECVDYFPSYELITAPVFQGQFFDSNMRNVRPAGVAFVMKSFFRDFCESSPPAEEHQPRSVTVERDDEGVICDEAVLEFFAQ